MQNTDSHGQTQTRNVPPGHVRAGPCESVSSPCPSVSLEALQARIAANGALSLLNLCIYLVDRQLKAQAKAFEEEGGFTERLYRRRTERRSQTGN
ncbi:MAG: hypothetical protein JXR37_15535 [Kiritimatiellae bacterium]|nr:hypothetical protein [Kiritimatiellia bacterium]